MTKSEVWFGKKYTELSELEKKQYQSRINSEYFKNHKEERKKYISEYLTKKYKEDKKWRLHRDVYVAKKHQEYRKKNIEDKWYDIRRELERENQEKSLDFIDSKYRKWTIGEINYLIENYYKKTYLEMAIELRRTYYSVGQFITKKLLKIIKKKNRELLLIKNV